MPPMYRTPEERKIAVVAAAGVAMHALVSSNFLSEPPKEAPALAVTAFEIAEAFLAEADRRFGA